MKIFFVKFTCLLVLVVLSVFPFLKSISKNFKDKFYYKFNYKASSLITGTSTALFGLNPRSINKANNLKKPFLNFAFTQATSPYGEVYYKAIMAKVNSDEKNGVFILEVAPLSVSSKKDTLPEEKLILNRLLFFNQDPNYDYILKNNQHPLYIYFLNGKKKERTNYFTDGWNENISTPDSVQVKKNIEKGVATFSKLFKEFSVSQDRVEWLGKTAASLSAYGKVIMIKMPVTAEMEKLQNNYYPQFNDVMNEIAKKSKSAFLDLSDRKDYHFIDLMHMNPASANKYSICVGDTIGKLLFK